MKFRSRKYLLAICSAAAAAVWFLLIHSRAPKVEVASPRMREIIAAVYATGNVEATEMFPVSSMQAGTLVELLAEERESVAAGQLLARLSNPELQAMVEQVKATEEYLRERLNRQMDLQQRRVISQEELERAKSEYQAAQAQRVAAEEKLAHLELRALTPGTVIRRDGEVGQLIPAYQTVFWLRSQKPLRVSAEVDEEDIVRVQVGQEVLMQTDAFPERMFHGVVREITPKGDPILRTYRVRVGLEEGKDLPIGMTLELNIITNRKANALVVPKSVIVHGHVWKVVDNTLVRQNVSAGIIGDEFAEITSGLSASDRVVISPDTSFAEGQKVAPVDKDPFPGDSSGTSHDNASSYGE